MTSYGKELILDLKECDIKKFTRFHIRKYLRELCELIDMKRENLHFWDYDGQLDKYNKAPDHLRGISAVQFITTSNITIHTLDVSKQILINVFSCKNFSIYKVIKFSIKFFNGRHNDSHVIMRGDK